MKDLPILLEVRSKVYMWLFNRKYKYKVFRPDIPEDAIRSDSPYNEVLIETNSRSELRIWMDLNGLKPEFPNLLSRKNRKDAEKNYETLNVRLVQ